VLGRAPFEVVAEASDRGELDRARERYDPHVIVLDPRLPGGTDPTGLVRSLVDEHVKVVVYGMGDDPLLAEQVLRAGALSYVVKEPRIARLAEAVASVAVGEVYVDPRLGLAARDRVRARLGEQLSPRAFVLIARGYTNREAAQTMGITDKTVETYRRRINDKLGLSGRRELVRLAIELGLLASPR
jgi:two-component system response regulator NreC